MIYDLKIKTEIEIDNKGKPSTILLIQKFHASITIYLVVLTKNTLSYVQLTVKVVVFIVVLMHGGSISATYILI